MARSVLGTHRMLTISLFLGTFAWSFVYVSLPFYIERVSTLDPASTLRWTGWILGISPVVTVMTAPVWGRLAGRSDPKRLYVIIELLQGAGFFVMAFARTLRELFLARGLLGLMGGASTFAFIIAGRGGGDVRRDVSAPRDRAIATRRSICAIAVITQAERSGSAARPASPLEPAA